MLQLEQSLQRDAVAFIMIMPQKAKMMRRPDHEGSERKGGGQEIPQLQRAPIKRQELEVEEGEEESEE